MPVFTENGISVNFPSNYFKFEDCEAYKAIKGRSVKEMDFGWFDAEKDTLWLIELKGYINTQPDRIHFQETDFSDKDVIGKKIHELVTKSIHSVCMVETDRSFTKSCLQIDYSDSSQLKLLHILNIKEEHKTYISAINDKLNSELEAYKAIFKISSITVVDYERAKEHFDLVV